MANGTRAEPDGQGPYPKAMDENQIGEAWADLGASFGASAGGDRMSFALRSLSYPDLLDQAVALAARQMAHPAFPEAMWLRDRERISASIRESLTKPGTVVQQRFAQAVYGTHPYGQRATPESLSRIGAQDLKNLHAQALRACRATVSVVGNTLHLTFDIPRGNDGAQGIAGQTGADGAPGPQGPQGPTGEVSQTDLNNGLLNTLSQTSANTNAVATLDNPFADPDVEILRQKVNELINMLRR
jgi:hypothetical protein